MKKAYFKTMGVFVCAAVLLMAFCVSGFAADKYVLKVASEYNDKHPTIVNAVMPWIKAVKEKSGGRLDIRFFNPNTIVPISDAYSALKNGVVDLALTVCWRVKGKFRVSTAPALPMIFRGAEAGSMTVWDLYQNHPEWRAEYDEIKVLWQWTSALMELHMKDTEVKTLDDLKGKKIIVWTASSREAIQALGANPVEIGPQDTYLSLERGMAEGVLCPLAPMRSFKISDATKYHLIVDLGLDTFFGAMNTKKWESLPDDLKQILMETTGEKMAQACGLSLDQGAIKDAKWMKDKGDKFDVLSPEQKKLWQEAVAPIHQKWLTTMKADGYNNIQAVYDDMMSRADKYNNSTVGGYAD